MVVVEVVLQSDGLVYVAAEWVGVVVVMVVVVVGGGGGDELAGWQHRQQCGQCGCRWLGGEMTRLLALALACFACVRACFLPAGLMRGVWEADTSVGQQQQQQQERVNGNNNTTTPQTASALVTGVSGVKRRLVADPEQTRIG
jgi:hypothetical protein